MQPQNPNQNKNLILFLVLSFLMLVGWTYFNFMNRGQQQRPPQTKPTGSLAAHEWPFGNRPKPEQAAIVARVLAAAMPGGSGLDAAVRPAAELVAIAYPPPPITPWPLYERRREVRNATVADLAALAPIPDLGQAARLAIELALLQTRPPVPQTPQSPVTMVDLGDDANYFLKVRVSSQGAAVREIVLNRFQMADGYGLPVWENAEHTKPRPLDLVPANRILTRAELTDPNQPIEFDKTDPFQHFVLYHYAKPDDDRPVDLLGKLNWKVVPPGVQTKDDRQEVSFVADIPGEVEITKTFSLARGDYHVGLSVSMKSLRQAGSEPGKFRYQLTGARGLPIEGEWYTTVFRNALIGYQHADGQPGRTFEDSRTIATKMGGDEIRRSEKVKAIQYAGVAVQFFASAIVIDTDQEKKDFIEWARPTMEGAVMKGRVRKFEIDTITLATSEKEMTFRLTPALMNAVMQGEIAPDAQPLPGKTIAVLWNREGDQFVATDFIGEDRAIPPILDDVTVRMMSEAVALAPGGTVTHKYLLYNGPVKVRLLGYLRGADAVSPELVERYENTLQLKTLTDFGMFSESGVMWWWTSLIIFFTNLMHSLLALLYNVTFEWSAGLCIIILTVMVRGVMFPVGRRQARMSKDMQEKMAKLQPEMKKIKEKNKDDPWALYQAQQELFKKHNVNQFAMLGGCLPLLAQLPIFMGLYYSLQESILFRLKPCLYMRNLAAPDMLIWWGEHIPVISQWSSQGGMFFLGPYFNLLPVIAVVLMVVQQAVMQPPAMDEQQEMNMKMMKWMSILFGLMFYKVAAGLCMYFIASSAWGLAERKLQFKKKEPDEETSATEPAIIAPVPRADPKKSRSELAKETGIKGLWQRLKEWGEEVLEQAAKQQQAKRDEGDGRKKKKRRDDETSRRNRED
jgi:YidC/Oxa1 family membrane protein insertase